MNRKMILPLFAVLLFAGCGGGVYVASGPQTGQELSNLPTDIDACVFWGKRGINTDEWLSDNFQKDYDPFFKSVRGVPSLEDATKCDLVVKVTVPRRGIWAAQLYSFYSKEPLLRMETKTSAGAALWKAIKSQGTKIYDESAPRRLGGAVFKALTKDTPAYQQIEREKMEYLAKKKEEEAAKALASGRMSKRDLKALQEAISGAARPKKKKKKYKSDVDFPKYKLRKRPKDYAIVIGIQDYSSLPPATHAERDAMAVKRHLIAQGIPARNIRHLSGSKATLSSIKGYLEEWLPRNAKPEGRVFFYFSGHGAPDVAEKQAYLVPWDGNPNLLKSTAYPTKKLYAHLGKLKAKEVLVAMDACFSGSGGRSVLPKGARPLVMKVATGSTPEKVIAFSAAKATQITSGLDDQGHGIFTYYFLKGLSGAAKDSKGRITAQSLFDYLKPQVEDAASLQNREQSPVLDTKRKGSVISKF